MAELKAVKRKVAAKSTNGHKQAPQKLKLLVTVVPRAKTEFFMDLIQSFEANMQFAAAARGTANSEIMHMMGLEDGEKRVIFSIVREDQAPLALAALQEKFTTIKNGKGIAMTVPLSSVIGASIYQFLADTRRTVKEER